MEATETVEQGLAESFSKQNPRIIEFPVTSANYITTRSGERITEVLLVVDIQDIPDNIPCELTNVRAQNLKGEVPDNITDSVINETNLVHMSHGMILSASNLIVENSPNGGKYCKLILTDPGLHGNLDGAHNYKIILRERTGAEGRREIKMTVFLGIEDKATLVQIMAALNGTVPVKQMSISNALGRYDALKDALASQPYSKDIAWRQNDPGRANGNDVMKVLNLFNTNLYDADNHPHRVYNSATVMRRAYEENEEKFRAFYPHLDKMLRMKDKIVALMPELYNNKSGRKFGRLTSYGISVDKKQYLPFEQTTVDITIPDGLVYPQLAAIRVLIGRSGNNKVVWKADPEEFYKYCGLSLMLIMFDKECRMSANSMGRSKLMYHNLYMEAERRLERFLRDSK